jgi:hypothetical protein
MSTYAALAAGLLGLLAGCASVPENDSVIVRNDAIDDYIKVAELEEIDAIRKRGELHHTVVTENYIILKDRRNKYLAVFRHKCRQLEETEVTPDIRHDMKVIRARFDSYRGCRIQALFGLSEGQATEILGLGEAPGR